MDFSSALKESLLETRSQSRRCGPQLCPAFSQRFLCTYSALGNSLVRRSVGYLPIHGTGFYSDNLQATNLANDGFIFLNAGSFFLTHSVYQYTGINKENFSGNVSNKNAIVCFKPKKRFKTV
jgi:hypothetical protein